MCFEKNFQTYNNQLQVTEEKKILKTNTNYLNSNFEHYFKNLSLNGKSNKNIYFFQTKLKISRTK